MSSPKKTARMSPKKSPKKKSKKESAAATTKEVKNEKALFSMNPKSISNDQIAKWIKAGDVDKMELTVLMGKGNTYINFILFFPSEDTEKNENFFLNSNKQVNNWLEKQLGMMLPGIILKTWEMSWNNQVNTEKIICPKNVELVHSEYKPVSDRVLPRPIIF